MDAQRRFALPHQDQSDFFVFSATYVRYKLLLLLILNFRPFLFSYELKLRIFYCCREFSAHAHKGTCRQRSREMIYLFPVLSHAHAVKFKTEVILILKRNHEGICNDKQ